MAFLIYADVPPLICDTMLERAKPRVGHLRFSRCIVSEVVTRLNLIIVDEKPCVLGIHTLFSDYISIIYIYSHMVLRKTK